MPERKRGGPKPKKAGRARPRKAAGGRAAPAAKHADPAATASVATAGAAPAATGQAERTLARPAEGRSERPAGGGTITIVQVRSGIQAPFRQKRILRSLGLRHPHQRVVRPDNPAVRGMVRAIPHLVRIEEGQDGA